MSSGTARPCSRIAFTAPTAVRLLVAKTAVGRRPRPRNVCMARYPPTRSTEVSNTSCGSKRDPGRRQGLFIPTPPITRGRDGQCFRDDGNPAVAKGDEMLDEPPRAADAVALDHIAVDAKHRAVDEHEWDPVVFEAQAGGHATRRRPARSAALRPAAAACPRCTRLRTPGCSRSCTRRRGTRPAGRCSPPRAPREQRTGCPRRGPSGRSPRSGGTSTPAPGHWGCSRRPRSPAPRPAASRGALGRSR